MKIVRDDILNIKPKPDKLRTFFIDHLNKVYCAKVHLLKHLPMIASQADFIDLQQAIIETKEDVEKQIFRMDEIFYLLKAKHGNKSCSGLIALIDEAYIAIQTKNFDATLKDLSIVFYLQNIESIEIASFKVLQIIAVKFKNKEVKQLLQENYDEANADKLLLLLILSKYVVN